MSLERPCSDCPFRCKSMQGWTGSASPAEFMDATMSDAPMPCHQTVDYNDPDWKEKWLDGAAGEHCAGAAVFFANIAKLSRDRDRPRLPADRKNVFTSPRDFIAYHMSGEFKSWL